MCDTQRRNWKACYSHSLCEKSKLENHLLPNTPEVETQSCKLYSTSVSQIELSDDMKLANIVSSVISGWQISSYVTKVITHNFLNWMIISSSLVKCVISLTTSTCYWNSLTVKAITTCFLSRSVYGYFLSNPSVIHLAPKLIKLKRWWILGVPMRPYL